MKKWKRFFGAALSLCLMCLLAISGAAASDKEPYTYTIRFFSGKQGTINGEKMVVIEGLHYGDRVTFDRNTVILNDGSKYYVQGIRKSGRDNNTVQETSFRVTEDQDYVVAYGILGKRAAYTINYLDEAGNVLAPNETYYGNVGDKPVVAYLYIEGYRPQAYNLTKTLSENAAENEFNFVYTYDPTGTGLTAEEEAGASGAEGLEAAGAGEDAPGGEEGQGQAPGGVTQDIQEEETPLGQGPEEIKDLDDEKVPLGIGFFFDSNAKLLGIPVPVVMVSGLILAGTGLWYFLIFRKKKKKAGQP